MLAIHVLFLAAATPPFWTAPKPTPKVLRERVGVVELLASRRDTKQTPPSNVGSGESVGSSRSSADCTAATEREYESVSKVTLIATVFA